jgi:hypothetical protein
VPAGEAVFFIPGAFAVADENEFVHGCDVIGGEPSGISIVMTRSGRFGAFKKLPRRVQSGA